MAKRFRRRSYARHIPAVIGVAALMSGFAVVKFSAVADANAKQQHTQLAAASRGSDQAASRGLPRSGDVSTSSTVDSTTSTTAAPITTEAPTTTAPPATVPPTTAAPTTVKPKPPVTAPPAPAAPVQPAASGSNSQTGGASYYAYKAGGCAHRTLPKGTVVTVTNLNNGKTTTCVVDDRGPYVGGRIIDLDTTVFRQIASTSSGVVPVRISW